MTSPYRALQFCWKHLGKNAHYCSQVQCRQFLSGEMFAYSYFHDFKRSGCSNDVLLADAELRKKFCLEVLRESKTMTFGPLSQPRH